jgi:hypothetical protein
VRHDADDSTAPTRAGRDAPPGRGLAAALTAAAQAVGLSVAADLIDAAEEALSPEGSAAMASAKALAAAMTAAQAAADAVAQALSATKGTDPAIPPALPGTLVTGAFNVLVAGLPLPNTPDRATTPEAGTSTFQRRQQHVRGASVGARIEREWLASRRDNQQSRMARRSRGQSLSAWRSCHDGAVPELWSQRESNVVWEEEDACHR